MKVRLNEDNIKWYLSEAGYDCWLIPSLQKLDPTYDSMIEMMLLMGLSEEEFPGTIIRQHWGTKCYFIEFVNGYSGYFEPDNLIFKENV